MNGILSGAGEMDGYGAMQLNPAALRAPVPVPVPPPTAVHGRTRATIYAWRGKRWDDFVVVEAESPKALWAVAQALANGYGIPFNVLDSTARPGGKLGR